MSPPNLQKYFEKCSPAFSEHCFILFRSPSIYQFLQYVELRLIWPVQLIRLTHLLSPWPPALFPCTVSQAHIPMQLLIAMCLSPGGTFDVDKYWQYTASLLARVRSQSAAIMSSMVGDGKSHTGFVGQEVMLYSFKKIVEVCFRLQGHQRWSTLCNYSTGIRLVLHICLQLSIRVWCKPGWPTLLHLSSSPGMVKNCSCQLHF